MLIEKVRPGEYRAQHGKLYIWVIREWRHRKWWWVVGTYNGYDVWDIDSQNGPFPTRKAAIASAIANYNYGVTH